MHTAETISVARRLEKLSSAPVDLLEVGPFDVRDCQRVLKRYLKDAAGPLTFNLTGGTKTMLLAAYMVAVNQRSLIVYLQTQDAVSRLYSYRVRESGLIETGSRDLPALLTARDYLEAHLPGYAEEGFSKQGERLTSGGEFEKAVHDALVQGQVDEVLAGVRPDAVEKNIDIDLFLRCGNQAGIVEVKLNSAKKAGLDQLATAGGREYLGTFTAKFLVLGNSLGSSLKALAQARGIQVIELPSYAAAGELSSADERKLVETVRKRLGAPVL